MYKKKSINLKKLNNTSQQNNVDIFHFDVNSYSYWLPYILLITMLRNRYNYLHFVSKLVAYLPIIKEYIASQYLWKSHTSEKEILLQNLFT